MPWKSYLTKQDWAANPRNKQRIADANRRYYRKTHPKKTVR